MTLFRDFSAVHSAGINSVIPPNSHLSKEQQLPEACPPILAFHLLLGQRPGLQRWTVRHGLQELRWLFNCTVKAPSLLEFCVHT